MNCRSGLSTTASHSGPIPELLQIKMKRVPAARICSANNSPPVPERKLLVCVVATLRKLTVCASFVSARTIGSSARRDERAAARLKPAAVALVMKLRRETSFPK